MSAGAESAARADVGIDRSLAVGYVVGPMGLLSWFFPTDADNLAKARALMSEGRHEKARKLLLHCHAPEAEALYDECSVAIDKADLVNAKKRLADAGFHGWKIEVSTKSARRKQELEGLVAEEIAKAGVDLGLPDIDEKKVKAAISRAERRARRSATTEVGAIRVVPMIDPKKLPRE